MTVVSPSQASTFDIPGVTFTGLAAPSRGARENAVWRLRMLPGTPPNPHRLTREEVIVAVSGSARVSIAGVESELPEGSAVIVPPDTEFALYQPGVSPPSRRSRSCRSAARRSFPTHLRSRRHGRNDRSEPRPRLRRRYAFISVATCAATESDRALEIIPALEQADDPAAGMPVGEFHQPPRSPRRSRLR